MSEQNHFDMIKRKPTDCIEDSNGYDQFIGSPGNHWQNKAEEISFSSGISEKIYLVEIVDCNWIYYK